MMETLTQEQEQRTRDRRRRPVGPHYKWVALTNTTLGSLSAAILTDAFPANQRGRALGINQIAGIGGSFIGLILGGILAAINWRLVFLVSVPVGIVGTIWAYMMLRETATSGVVLSTLREAADKDYQLTVLSDCCVDNDEEVQRVLLSKVFPRQAEVVTAEAWSASSQT